MSGTNEGASTEAPSPLTQAHLEQTARDETTGYRGPAGVSIHTAEAVEMFNLLEANPREWNRRLRVVLAGWILHLQSEGKIDGHFEVTEKTRGYPGRKGT